MTYYIILYSSLNWIKNIRQIYLFPIMIVRGMLPNAKNKLIQKK